MNTNLPNLPSVPPANPIPVSVVIYEVMRLMPHMMAMGVFGLLMANHTLTGDTGMVAILAVLAGQLYPRRTQPPGGG